MIYEFCLLRFLSDVNLSKQNHFTRNSLEEKLIKKAFFRFAIFFFQLLFGHKCSCYKIGQYPIFSSQNNPINKIFLNFDPPRLNSLPFLKFIIK